MNKDVEIKIRFKEIIIKRGESVSSFARLMGIKPVHLQVTLADGQKGISATIYKGLANMKTPININWLITGRGSSDFIEVDISLVTEIRDANKLIASLERILRKE